MKPSPRVLLLTPPMTQLNTPYPATAYLTGFLRQQGYDTTQFDLSIELVCRLFSKSGLKRVLEHIENKNHSDSVDFFKLNFNHYLHTVDKAVSFLQGNDPSIALRIVSRNFLPEGPRFKSIDDQDLFWSFGALGIQDKAKYFASLFIDDLADVIREGIDSKFTLSRYGEKLAASQNSFDSIEDSLKSRPTLIGQILSEITEEVYLQYKPDVVGLTAPFPGNVLGAFQVAKTIKKTNAKCITILGGGYPNTELRSLSEPKVFNYFDYITLDDGEKPFECILEFILGTRDLSNLLRTYLCKNKKVEFISDPKEHDISFKNTGTPTYDGLALNKYMSVLELLNPMHRLWSDCRWNKITLSHGCYWKKCSFCDVTLDYIGRYEPASADLTIERMNSMIQETGQTGFHLVDEAAPPVLLRNLSKRIVEKNLNVTWWGNIRFEKAFDLELTTLMSNAGCIAVSGGLEVASDRLLKMMNKGITIDQVKNTTRNFQNAGIMVHAYLMYGFPTQTLQETIDSLEQVRQLFEEGLIQSAFWHRFSATTHSPIGKDPSLFGIKIQNNGKVSDKNIFSRNDLEFFDPTNCDHDQLSYGLNKAIYNYMHGVGLEEDVRFWFDFEVPQASLSLRQMTRELT